MSGNGVPLGVMMIIDEMHHDPRLQPHVQTTGQGPYQDWLAMSTVLLTQPCGTGSLGLKWGGGVWQQVPRSAFRVGLGGILLLKVRGGAGGAGCTDCQSVGARLE
jgi:hypothetical protein